MKGIAFFLIFILAAVCVKAQKDTIYFIFNGSVKNSCKVMSDSLTYKLRSDSTWFNIEISTPFSLTHELAHVGKYDKWIYLSRQDLFLLRERYNLSYLTSLTGRQFIDRFGYLQYGHVYYLIPLLDKDDRGYKAYEFTFESNFLNVE